MHFNSITGFEPKLLDLAESVASTVAPPLLVPQIFFCYIHLSIVKLLKYFLVLES